MDVVEALATFPLPESLRAFSFSVTAELKIEVCVAFEVALIPAAGSVRRILEEFG